MPLIIMSGIPCSGKTTVAKKLAAFLEREAGKKVDIVNEESLNLNKQASYRGMPARHGFVLTLQIRISRRTLERSSGYTISIVLQPLSFSQAAVDRLLQRDTVVIFDSLNYIKVSASLTSQRSH